MDITVVERHRQSRPTRRAPLSDSGSAQPDPQFHGAPGARHAEPDRLPADERADVHARLHHAAVRRFEPRRRSVERAAVVRHDAHADDRRQSDRTSQTRLAGGVLDRLGHARNDPRDLAVRFDSADAVVVVGADAVPRRLRSVSGHAGRDLQLPDGEGDPGLETRPPHRHAQLSRRHHLGDGRVAQRPVSWSAIRRPPPVTRTRFCCRSC